MGFEVFKLLRATLKAIAPQPDPVGTDRGSGDAWADDLPASR
jgi:hypothetical protein